MFLTHCQTQKKVRAKVGIVKSTEIAQLLKTGQFGFDWVSETKTTVHALTLEIENETVGLMALKDIPGEFRMEIVLLESSIENIGKLKKYDGVVGCLMAFAARLAFLKGYGGFVSLTPKTALDAHYRKAYGFQPYGRQLAIEGASALLLIKKYLENG